MRARLDPAITATPEGEEAAAILRACVHCGFCNATCPTYQLTGDERDGPRGRIYQMKSLLEGEQVGTETRLHLDRCLTCRSCETTCPSGVRYGRLLDLVKPRLEQSVPRTPSQRVMRWALRKLIPSPLFGWLLRVGRWLRPILPAVLVREIPPLRPVGVWPSVRHARRWLALIGCVQADARPSIDAAAARVLDRCGQSLSQVPGSGCCGALAYHLGAHGEAAAMARKNIDAWWPQLEAGATGVLSTASGCTSFLKDYGELLAHDPDYAARAQALSAKVRDLSEVIESREVAALGLQLEQTIAIQTPCSLQHALRGNGRVEGLLAAAGARLVPVADGHLCCGSAGTYSLLQPAFSKALRKRKVSALEAGSPEVVATANIGCMLHLEKGMRTPIRHWIEVLDEAAARTAPPRPER